MSIRESIAKLEPGDRLVVERRYQANYARSLAKECGKLVKQEKVGSAWELFCIGYYRNNTLVWLKNIRYKRDWWRRNRAKT